MSACRYTQPVARQLIRNLDALRTEHAADRQANRREWWRAVRELAIIADGGDVDGAHTALVEKTARELQEVMV